MADHSRDFSLPYNQDQPKKSQSEVTDDRVYAHLRDMENQEVAKAPSKFDPNENLTEVDARLELLKRQHQESIRDIERQQAQLKENHHLRTEVASLTHDLGDARTRSEELERQLKKLQQDAIRMPTQLFWAAEDEQRIEHEIHQLHVDIRIWARKFSIKTSEDPNAPMGNATQGFLPKVVDLVGGKVSRNLRNEPMVHKLPYLLLSTMVSRAIYKESLRCPWFFFSCLPDGDNSLKESLVHSYEMLLKHDVVKAHLWRATSLQLLLPQTDSPDGQDEQLAQTRNMTIRAIKIRCLRMSLFMLNNFCKPLLKEIPDSEIDERSENFQQIFEKAGLLFARLHAQRTYLTCALLEDFKDIPFKVSSAKMRAHPLRKLDEEDTSLDGREVAMVIYPAVYMSGTPDGRNYDKERVLSKAVVWVDE